jgi:group I intron endonuclease
MANGVIYGIIDPITNQIRYVGQTINFNKRKSSHYKTAISNKNNTHVYNWLRSLYDNFIIPEFIILEECNIELLDETEIFFINYFRMLGFDLTNSSIGGKSRRGFKQSEEMKKKISIIMRGNTWNKGKILPEVTKQKMSLSHTGKTHTNISKLKVAKAKIKHKPIIQLSKNDKVIKTFNSAYEASKKLNINRKSIGNVLAGRSVTAGNYKWIYY